MNSTGRDKDCIPGSHWKLLHEIEDAAISDRLLYFFWGNPLLKATQYLCVLFSMQDMPGFCFAKLAHSFEFNRLCVVGMYLQGKPLRAVEQFN